MFREIFAELVGYTDRVCGIEWQWASLDSATVKAPKGGDCTGPNPTDRAKLGVKRHVLTDGRGVPVAIGISAANVHDKRLAEPLMDAVVIRQGPAVHRPQHLCLDKGYDYPVPDRSRFHAIARGSAMECGAIIDILTLMDICPATELADAKQLLVRIVSMLSNMCR